MNRKRLLERIFIIALMLLIPWPVAYAYDSTGETARETIRIATAEPAKQPAWTAFGKAIGSVTAGDLFYIDATDNPADTSVTLCLTNAPELFHTYRYIILHVGLYRQIAEDTWQKVTGYNGEPIPDTFITMRKGQVGFNLPGLANYKITIDDGSFYCHVAAGEGSASPGFYLEANEPGNYY